MIVEARVEGAHADVDAHLVVALAGAAVGDGGGAVLVRRLDQLLGDQRPADGRGQRVLVLVERVGHERRQAVVLGELLLGVDGHGGDGAGRLRALHDRRDVLDAAEVDEAGDDVVAVLLLEPRDEGRGVETAGVGEDDGAVGGAVALSVGLLTLDRSLRDGDGPGPARRSRPPALEDEGGVRAEWCLRARPLGDDRDSASSPAPCRSSSEDDEKVSSPASVPTTSVWLRLSIWRATVEAVPISQRTTTQLLGDRGGAREVAQHVARRLLGVLGPLARAEHVLGAPQVRAHLLQVELADVARDGRLRDLAAEGAERAHELALGGDLALLDDRLDEPLALGLAHRRALRSCASRLP